MNVAISLNVIRPEAVARLAVKFQHTIFYTSPNRPVMIIKMDDPLQFAGLLSYINSNASIGCGRLHIVSDYDTDGKREKSIVLPHHIDVLVTTF